MRTQASSHKLAGAAAGEAFQPPAPCYELAGMAAAEAAFCRRFPGFDPDGAFARLRRTEYGRLDRAGHVYLDYTGGGLHADGQIVAHAELLRDQVLGNPHSNNPSSLASSALVEEARQAVCDFLRAPRDEYLCVFTANASAALRLVGEAYPFAPGGRFALTVDNHNSVNGIREFARRRGARLCYVPVTAPGLRIDRAAMSGVLRSGAGIPAAPGGARNLLAFPAQSNFSGVQHDPGLVAEAHQAGWDVLLDAAAYAPTNPVDVGRIGPDFAAFSFYKITGYPTGAGCLLIRRDRAGLLERPWFAGGTVTIASVRGDGYYLEPGEAAFEDGTVDYLNLPAVTAGLRHIQRAGQAAIQHRVHCLTGWLLDALTGLRHAGGRAVAEILGPVSTRQRGGTVTFRLRDRDGIAIDDRLIEELAGQAGISLRTGCFCNPGAGEVALGLSAGQLLPWFGRDQPVTAAELRDGMQAQHGVLPSATRISVGVASNFADVYRFMCFVQRFADHPAADHPAGPGRPWHPAGQRPPVPEPV
jgi:molybdenum cofactor sulfurtransferase